MADERTKAPYNETSILPRGHDWESLKKLEGDDLETHYRHVLERLAKEKGVIGLIFRKAQPKIQEPAMLRRLIVDLIDREQWASLDADVKGDTFEGLLEKTASEGKAGAGQYFTPRPLIRAIVDVMQPKPNDTICDPACGTGGFLIAAYEYITNSGRYKLDRDELEFMKHRALHGVELVDTVARLGLMNLVLHGINGKEPPIEGGKDSLSAGPSEHYPMVLTNPPFGKKSSVTIVNEEGESEKESLIVHRDDFWTTTSNKQLNFVQHVYTLLEQHGRAAVVVPDNVLFEGGSGQTVRQELLKKCDFHTLLRLPTGIFYAQGVKANVLFFDRKPASDTPWTQKVWIYDLRTNQHFTLRTRPLRREDLDDFVKCFNPENRHKRKESDRFHAFDYEELLKRDKVNLDIFWLKDDGLEDSADLPPPVEIAQEIVDDLQDALEQFTAVLDDLRSRK